MWEVIVSTKSTGRVQRWTYDDEDEARSVADYWAGIEDRQGKRKYIVSVERQLYDVPQGDKQGRLFQ